MSRKKLQSKARIKQTSLALDALIIPQSSNEAKRAREFFYASLSGTQDTNQVYQRISRPRNKDDKEVQDLLQTIKLDDPEMPKQNMSFTSPINHFKSLFKNLILHCQNFILNTKYTLTRNSKRLYQKTDVTTFSNKRGLIKHNSISKLKVLMLGAIVLVSCACTAYFVFYADSNDQPAVISSQNQQSDQRKDDAFNQSLQEWQCALLKYEQSKNVVSTTNVKESECIN